MRDCRSRLREVNHDLRPGKRPLRRVGQLFVKQPSRARRCAWRPRTLWSRSAPVGPGSPGSRRGWRRPRCRCRPAPVVGRRHPVAAPRPPCRRAACRAARGRRGCAPREPPRTSFGYAPRPGVRGGAATRPRRVTGAATSVRATSPKNHHVWFHAGSMAKASDAPVRVPQAVIVGGDDVEPVPAAAAGW